MQTESTRSLCHIVPTFHPTPFVFRELINVRAWHAIGPADDPGRFPAGCRPARAKTARLRRLGFLALLGAGLFAASALRAGQSVSISWNASTNSGVAGYTFFCGTNSGVYTSQFNVGTNTTVTLTGLKGGQMNYFAVAAYDSMGMQGPISSQITYLVPGMERLAPPPGPGQMASLTFSAAVGHSYDVQASSNLLSWTTIWSSGTINTNGWVTYQDPQSATLKQRYYRLVLH